MAGRSPRWTGSTRRRRARTLDIGFTILQHGRTPVDVDGVVIFVVDEDGDSTQFAAEPEGTVGRYRATVVFPESGTYRWSVVQGWFGAQDLGTLDIEPGGSASAAVWPLALVAGAGVAGTLAWRHTRRRTALATTNGA